MTLFQIITVSIVGLFAGVLSGMFGIGGGVIIVPVIQFFAKFHVKEAIGTSLAALLLPCTLPAVLSYYRVGQVNIMAAAIIAAGLLIGAYAGSLVTLELPDLAVKRVFGVFLLIIAVRYLTSAA